MLVTSTHAPARRLIVEMLTYLVGAAAFWLTLNWDTDQGFSLHSRFGMNIQDFEALLVAANLASVEGGNFKINVVEFQHFIKGEFPFMQDKIELGKHRTDFAAHVEGKPISKDRKLRATVHTLRIGHKTPRTASNMLEQKDDSGKLLTTPPRINRLKEKQRSLAREAAPLIVSAILTDPDLYQRFIDEPDGDAAPKKPFTVTVDIDVADPAAEKTVEKAPIPDAQSMLKSPPPPAKRLKQGDATALPMEHPPGDDARPTAFVSPPVDLDAKNYPTIAKVRGALGDQFEEGDLDLLFMEIGRVKKKDRLVTVRGKYGGQEESWVHVPVSRTDESFRKKRQWLYSAINANAKGDTEHDGIRRVGTDLLKRHPDPMMEALKDAHYPVVERMNEVKLAAMFEAANINLSQEENLLQHLRDHFGKKTFATRRKVRMLSKGHTPVTAHRAMHAYEDGEAEEVLEYATKDIPLEVLTQISRRLQGAGIDITKVKIKRIDIMAGGDHGGGTFQAGTNIVVVFEDDDIPSITFDLALAEVVCRKDSAEVLKKTIEPCLTEGFKKLSQNSLVIGLDEKGNIECTLDPARASQLTSTVTPTKLMYCVGDLAYYAMVLGREHSSGTRCYLCRLSAKEFADLHKRGEPWTYDVMNSLAAQAKELARKSKSKKAKDMSVEGVKDEAWWQFFPLENFLVPLLHEMIGIGNDLFDNFKDIVNAEIECLDPKEVTTRRKVTLCETAIASEVAKRDDWDKSPNGKKLASFKGKVYRRKAALKKLGVVFSEKASPASRENASVDALLAELDAYVSNEDVVEEAAAEDDDDDVEEDGDDDNPTSTSNSNSHESNVPDLSSLPDPNTLPAKVKESIDRHQKALATAVKDMKPLQAERDKLAKEVKRGRALLARLKKKLTEFRSKRKKSKDGMEAKMVRVLRNIGVELTRYHGGSLAGMDIKKVIANATYVFDEFADILKKGKREDCKMSDADIDFMCEQHKQAYLLWDGAFSAARTIDPTEEDILLYERFVLSAVRCHISIGCSVTHKVHLMWRHVAHQMRTIPGGLGEKMEDWVELQHQSGARVRRRFRGTNDIQKKANSRAGAEHRGTNPQVLAQQAAVKSRAARNLAGNEGKISLAEQRQKDREARRMAALQAFELKRSAAFHIRRWLRRINQ